MSDAEQPSDDSPSIMDEVVRLSDEFQEQNLGGMTFYGRAGFHTFYDNDEPLTSGVKSALHEAFEEATEEIYLDEHTIEDKYGEVTPETVTREFEAQFEEFLGWDAGEAIGHHLRTTLETRAAEQEDGR